MRSTDSKIVLPIKTNPSITSECWTYHKLSIIETSPDANAWLASHLGLYFDSNFNAFFGEYNDLYHLDYFHEILQYQEIPIEKINPKEILNIVIKEIKNGNYVAIYLPHPKFIIHEIILYGFDQKNNILFYNDMIEGKFRNTSISFEKFEESQNKVYDYFKRHPFSRVITSWYFFPITRLSLKDYTDDLCLIKAINNLYKAAEGKRILLNDINLNGECANSYIHYTGLGCLVGFGERLKEYIRDQQFIKGDIFDDLSNKLINTLFKIYEYQRIVLNSMLWISCELGNEAALSSHILEIKKLVNKMNTVYMLAIKFKQTNNWNIFYSLFEKYKEIYTPFRRTLNTFCQEAERLLFDTKKICDKA